MLNSCKHINIECLDFWIKTKCFTATPCYPLQASKVPNPSARKTPKSHGHGFDQGLLHVGPLEKGHIILSHLGSILAMLFQAICLGCILARICNPYLSKWSITTNIIMRLNYHQPFNLYRCWLNCKMNSVDVVLHDQSSNKWVLKSRKSPYCWSPMACPYTRLVAFAESTLSWSSLRLSHIKFFCLMRWDPMTFLRSGALGDRVAWVWCWNCKQQGRNESNIKRYTVDWW